MIYWKLFYTFFKIGLFNFGGGYAMISFIQNEVVIKNNWLTLQGDRIQLNMWKNLKQLCA